MSKTTSILSNHNLYTTSLQALAVDLSARMQATIIFGYVNQFDYNSLKLGLESNYDFIILGSVNAADSQAVYRLIDCNYQFTKFLEQFGEVEFESDYFIEQHSYIKDQILESKVSISFELVNMQEDCDTLIHIYRDSLELWSVDDLNWRYFQRCFLFNMTINDIEYLNIWRIKNRDWIYKFGGNYMFVACIEDHSSFIIYDAFSKSMDTIKKLIIEKLYDQMVNIPNYIKNKCYLTKPEYIQIPYDRVLSRKVDYAKANKASSIKIVPEYPNVFYDDFHDLPDSKIIAVDENFDIIYNGLHIIDNEIENKIFYQNTVIKRKKVKFSIPENYFFLYKCFVSGLQYYNFYVLDFDLSINQEVFLKLEPTNKFDKYAIEIYTDIEEKTSKLGYIPQIENKMLTRLIENDKKLKCFLKSISEKEINLYNMKYAVSIEIYLEK
jgi:hypothetical protein